MLPLDGVKVIDLSHAAAGPCCAMLLADMGAEVIKIEPLGGEFFRNPFNGSFLMNLSRNKRGMALDLGSEEGHEIAFKLVAKADVIVESFTPGIMDRLGLGYDVISQINPMVVYCAISGFGQTGPYRERPAFDPVAQAMSGMMLATGEAGRPPVRVAPSTVDYGAAMLGAYQIALALLSREKSGKGQRIDVSLFDTAVFYMGIFITNYSMTGQLPVREGSGAMTFSPYQVFETKDKLVFIGVFNDRSWENLCLALNLDDLAADSRYNTNDSRRQNRDELTKTLSQVLKQYGSDELVAKLMVADVPCAPLLNVDEVIEDSQVIAKGMIIEADYPGKGKVKLVRPPINMSETTPELGTRAPLIGEHTNEILKELDYSQTKIDQLAKKGIVSQYTP